MLRDGPGWHRTAMQMASQRTPAGVLSNARNDRCDGPLSLFDVRVIGQLLDIENDQIRRRMTAIFKHHFHAWL